MAGRIPQHFIDELVSRVDIVEVIGQRVTLKRSGSNHMACCPFHNEKTPSFSVSQPKQFYHCFGCGANGSAIGFLMEYENMHFVDAVEMLAESVGMEVPRDERDAKDRDDVRPLYKLMDEVTAFYRRCLREAPTAIDYLKRRGLDNETAKRYGIGWTGASRGALVEAFPDRIAELVKTGMLGESEGDRAPYPRFRDRIMFPIRDRRGRTIGFGGRVLDDTEPKYLNSPETPIFRKGSEVYGLHEARRTMQDEGSVIVVEGYMDVVALARAGVDNAVATLGTAAGRQHSETLFRSVPNIVFCFDGDRAGKAAAWRALQATLPVLEDGRDAHFLFLPDGEDPDSYVKAHGKAGFEDLLSNKVSIVDQLYAHLSADIDTGGIGGKAQLAERARPLMKTIPGAVYRQLAHRQLEHLIGIPLNASDGGQGNRFDRNGSSAGSERTRGPGGANRSRRGGSGGRALTYMSKAVLLVLQYPRVVAEMSPEDIDFDDKLPGGAILQKLVSGCYGDPSISTARLLERFRDSPDEKTLHHLATIKWWVDGPEPEMAAVVADFEHCIKHLSAMRSDSHVSRVDAESSNGLVGSMKRRR